MDQFTEEEYNQFFIDAQRRIGVAIKLEVGIPCAVIRANPPCMNKATIIIAHYDPNRIQYTFDPPLCEQCTRKMIALYTVDSDVDKKE